MKSDKSQFRNQTNQAASQGLRLLSPLALKKRQHASSSHVCDSLSVEMT